MEPSDVMEPTPADHTAQPHNAVEHIDPANPTYSEKAPPAEPDLSKLSDIKELIILSTRPTSPDTKDKLYRFLQKYHLEAPELKYLFGQSVDPMAFSLGLEELARAVKTDNPDPDAQGAALHLLAEGYQKASDLVATLEGLDLSVDDYIALMYPEVTEEQKGFFAPLHRWTERSARTLREQAKRYADKLKDYSKVKLQVAFIHPESGEFTTAEIGRIGKRAKGMSLALENTSVGQAMADFEVADLQGNPVTLSDHKGKAVIVYVWSSSCGPCKKSMPYYREIAEQMNVEGQPFEMITLSVDDDEAKLEAFMEENAMPFINCRIGKNSRLLHEWGVNGFPTGMVLDKEGVIKAKGQLGKAFLNSAIRQGL